MAYTTIDDPSAYFQTALYTGSDNGALTQVVTNDGNSDLQPDWIWIKRRNSAANHSITDTVRGLTIGLSTSTTAAEVNDDFGVTAVGSDSFSVRENTSAQGQVNEGTLVAWQWKAGGSASSNSDGSITSSVSANTTAGFSIVSYTGNGTAGATIGHGLGKVPEVMLIKGRTANADNWRSYHKSLPDPTEDYIKLNSTDAKIDGASTTWNSTGPTSSVFSVATDNSNNANTKTYIAYCFNSVKGYSKFGSYTGNGNADGTFVYTGFRVGWLMIKNTSTGSTKWTICDSKRDGFNDNNHRLFASETDAESTSNPWEMYSNGFKMTTTGSFVNASGSNYIYMAFAENPFVTSTGVPATAR
jgi:hypothetical protein